MPDIDQERVLYWWRRALVALGKVASERSGGFSPAELAKTETWKITPPGMRDFNLGPGPGCGHDLVKPRA